MKSIFKISFIAFILVLVSMANVFAIEIVADLEMDTNKTDVKVGEIVTINVSANCETGIEGIDSILEYDNTKLELQGVNIDTKFSNMSGVDDATGEYKLTVISNSTETIKQSNIATITLKVLETVTEGEQLSVILSGIEIGDSNDEWTTIEDRQITLKLEKENDEDNSNLGGDDDNNQDADNDEYDGNDNLEDGNNQITDTEKEDNTKADKEFDKAGLKKYTMIIVIGFIVIAIISYKKYNQYK